MAEIARALIVETSENSWMCPCFVRRTPTADGDVLAPPDANAMPRSKAPSAEARKKARAVDLSPPNLQRIFDRKGRRPAPTALSLHRAAMPACSTANAPDPTRNRPRRPDSFRSESATYPLLRTSEKGAVRLEGFGKKLSSRCQWN